MYDLRPLFQSFSSLICKWSPWASQDFLLVIKCSRGGKKALNKGWHILKVLGVLYSPGQILISPQTSLHDWRKVWANMLQKWIVLKIDERIWVAVNILPRHRKRLFWWRAERGSGWAGGPHYRRASFPISPRSPPSCSLLLMRELGPNPVFRDLMKAVAYLNHFHVAFNLKRLHFGGWVGSEQQRTSLLSEDKIKFFLCDVAALKEPILCHVTSE